MEAPLDWTTLKESLKDGTFLKIVRRREPLPSSFEREAFVALIRQLLRSCDIIVMRNRFPYDIEAEHYVVWGSDIETVFRRASCYSGLVWENPLSHRSVPEIPHVHVFLPFKSVQSGTECLVEQIRNDLPFHTAIMYMPSPNGHRVEIGHAENRASAVEKIISRAPQEWRSASLYCGSSRVILERARDRDDFFWQHMEGEELKNCECVLTPHNSKASWETKPYPRGMLFFSE